MIAKQQGLDGRVRLEHQDVGILFLALSLIHVFSAFNLPNQEKTSSFSFISSAFSENFTWLYERAFHFPSWMQQKLHKFCPYKYGYLYECYLLVEKVLPNHTLLVTFEFYWLEHRTRESRLLGPVPGSDTDWIDKSFNFSFLSVKCR